MLYSCLNADGYSIDMAEGVDAALELMESNDYDILLVDKNLSGTDGSREGGIELLRHVRSKLLSSEVIMMTGYPTVETAIEALKLGAFDYICKPFSLEDLRLKIRRLLKYRHFVNPDYAIGVYRCLRAKILELIERGPKMSDEELERTLLSLNDEIDRLFLLLKESEKVILIERESLSHIAILAEELKMNCKEMDSSYNLVEKVSQLSRERL
jgi:DNA-binding NtrC family response regulator